MYLGNVEYVCACRGEIRSSAGKQTGTVCTGAVCEHYWVAVGCGSDHDSVEWTYVRVFIVGHIYSIKHSKTFLRSLCADSNREVEMLTVRVCKHFKCSILGVCLTAHSPSTK